MSDTFLLNVPDAVASADIVRNITTAGPDAIRKTFAVLLRAALAGTANTLDAAVTTIPPSDVTRRLDSVLLDDLAVKRVLACLHFVARAAARTNPPLDVFARRVKRLLKSSSDNDAGGLGEVVAAMTDAYEKEGADSVVMPPTSSMPVATVCDAHVRSHGRGVEIRLMDSKNASVGFSVPMVTARELLEQLKAAKKELVKEL
eukprot:PhM_4_TR17640/c0_g1_i1/m.91316